MRRSVLAIFLATIAVGGCAPSDAGAPAQQVVLGPVEGRDLPGVDLDRVRVGDVAPDFSLASLAGPVVTLSEFRGTRNVILVFYRGYW
jgi:hypothetical protein